MENAYVHSEEEEKIAAKVFVQIIVLKKDAV